MFYVVNNRKLGRKITNKRGVKQIWKTQRLLVPQLEKFSSLFLNMAMILKIEDEAIQGL